MSKYGWMKPRERSKHLLIVEGNHEKNDLIKLILKVFPEIDVDIDNIIIYGTNIYMLYDEIVKSYHEEWYLDDVDLPFVLSDKMGYEEKLYKNDFKNILLIFDYERHDSNYSDDKIIRMQEYFSDVEDVGKLFINYPMVESYQHLYEIPDTEYANRKVSVTLQPGYKYKNEVKNTFVAKAVSFQDKIVGILNEAYNIEKTLSEALAEELLNCSDKEELTTKMEERLCTILADSTYHTAKCHLLSVIGNMSYLERKINYYSFMRDLFCQIMYHNIRKANKIQNGNYNVDNSRLKECFESLDYINILNKQINDSFDPIEGIIWVLNTCVLFVPDYNYELVNPVA